MDFNEACSELYLGQKITCGSWCNDAYIHIVDNQIVDEEGEEWTEAFLSCVNEDKTWSLYKEIDHYVTDENIVVRKNKKFLVQFANKEQLQAFIKELESVLEEL